MLRLVNVKKSFGQQRVLDGVSLTVAEGEKLVIMGQSGGGKSVLLRLIVGLVPPDEGEIWMGDVNLATLSEKQLTPLRRSVGFVFQSGALFDSLSVGENVAFGLREQGGLTEKEIGDQVKQILNEVGLPEQQQKFPSEISGGMRKRVALARALVRKPSLLLYDEPTAGLDPIAADSIDRLIVRLGNQSKSTSVLITHDIKSAYYVADRIAMLHEGKIYAVMNPSEMKASTDPVIYKFVQGISGEAEAAIPR
jgi:phospholipid/cholesterol/gamma-HCH transport system ATP-binding protein